MKIINYCTEWENGKIGIFEESNLELIWIELTLTEGIPKYRYPNAERYQKAPVVAKGFIVYLLKAIEANPNVKSAKLYDSYYNIRLRQYKEIKESEPDAFSRDLASEFHNKHIEEEQKYAAYSKRLFDYLKEDYCTLIKRYCDSYFAYINRYGNNDQPKNQEGLTEQLHFHGDFTDDEITSTFKKLIQGKYIQKDSDLVSWIYICTGTKGKTPIRPIEWKKKSILLGLFVFDLFSNTDKNNIWEITAKCFTINGQEPNTNSIKVNLSKIKGDDTKLPKEYDQMKKDITFDLM